MGKLVFRMEANPHPHLIGGGQLDPQYFTHEERALAQYVISERVKFSPTPGSYGFKDDYLRRVFELLAPTNPLQHYGGLGESQPKTRSNAASDLISCVGASDYHIDLKPSHPSALHSSLLLSHYQQAANAPYQ